MNIDTATCVSMGRQCHAAPRTTNSPLIAGIIAFTMMLLSSLALAADTTRPTQPGSLSASLSSTGQVRLNWNASYDDSSTLLYAIYRDNKFISFANLSEYTDAAAYGNTRHTYSVRAFDLSLNISGASSISISTPKNNASRSTNGLVAFYPFTAGSGTNAIDQSGYGGAMNLKLTGSVTWSGAGNGVTLTGGRVGTSGAASKVINTLRASNRSSFEVWAKPLSLTQTGPTRFMAIAKDVNQRNYMLGVEQKNVHARLRHTGKSDDKPHLITSNNPLSNKLMHIVHTFDGATERLYIDGVLQSNKVVRAGGYSNWYTDHKLSIGNEATSNRGFSGLIQMVAIYNRPLNSSEIQSNFAAGPNIGGSVGGGNNVGSKDSDGDSIPDSIDNCPLTSNPGQANLDKDAAGDVCDSDGDNDGVLNHLDAFKWNAAESKDSDGDGIGDNADSTPFGGSTAKPSVSFTAQLQNVSSGKCMEVVNAGTANNNDVRQASCSSSERHQKVNFIPVAGQANTYTLQFQHSNSCLDVHRANSANGTNMQQMFCHGGVSQRIRMVNHGSAGYTLYTATGSNKVVDLNKSNGNVIQWQDYGKSNQRWRLHNLQNGSGSSKPSGSGTGSLTFSWTKPNTRTSGASLSTGDLARYQIFATSVNGGSSRVFTVNDTNATSYKASSVAVGTYQVSMVAVDKQGMSSRPSNSVTVTVR